MCVCVCALPGRGSAGARLRAVVAGQEREAARCGGTAGPGPALPRGLLAFEGAHVCEEELRGEVFSVEVTPLLYVLSVG